MSSCSRTAVVGRRTLLFVLTQRSLVDHESARRVVDYSLARRAALLGLRSGRVRREDVCDAQTYLRRAAGYHGRRTTDTCPVCQHERLVEVTYAFSDSFPDAGNGRARARKELRELATTLPEISVHQVEVCLSCGWNFLRTSFVLGTGEPVPRGRSRSTSGSRA